MATAEEVAATVLDIVQDDSYNEDSVVALLNKCIGELSRKIVFPSLDTEGTVLTVTDGPSVELPTDFQRNLYHCKDHTSFNFIEIFNSKDQLSRYLDNRLSSVGTLVRGVAAVRPLLYYTPIPTVATTLTLRYQRKPDEITSSTDLDTILPDGFDDIWENYALWKLFEKIEQGTDGQKIDTNYYQTLYAGLKDELVLSMKEGVSMPEPAIARMERW